MLDLGGMNLVVSLLHLSGITAHPEVQHEPVLLAIPSERHYRHSSGLWRYESGQHISVANGVQRSSLD